MSSPAHWLLFSNFRLCNVILPHNCIAVVNNEKNVQSFIESGLQFQFTPKRLAHRFVHALLTLFSQFDADVHLNYKYVAGVPKIDAISHISYHTLCMGTTDFYSYRFDIWVAFLRCADPAILANIPNALWQWYRVKPTTLCRVMYRNEWNVIAIMRKHSHTASTQRHRRSRHTKLESDSEIRAANESGNKRMKWIKTTTKNMMICRDGHYFS